MFVLGVIIIDLIIKKTRRDWIVVNKKYGTHTHFKSKWGCKVIIHLIKNGIEPESDYFIESKRRLIEHKEYKQRYVNKR